MGEHSAQHDGKHLLGRFALTGGAALALAAGGTGVAFAGEAASPSQSDDHSCTCEERGHDEGHEDESKDDHEGDGGLIGGVLDPLMPGAGDDDPLETSPVVTVPEETVPEETTPRQVNSEQDESGSATNTDTGQATDAITDLSMS